MPMNLSAPKVLLHFAGLAVLVTACALYRHLDGSWVRFGILFLAPDLFMLGFLAGRTIGAHVYNAAHTYTTPLILAAVSYFTEQAALLGIAVIWIAHIGFDRVVGYGLKYQS